METADKGIYKIAGGYVAFVIVHGHQVNGRGKDEASASADLQANLALHGRLYERAEKTRRALEPPLSLP
jgi:hypothetical protein